MQQRSRSDTRIIDVSNYQGMINWSQVAASGIKGAYCKATEGATGRDSTFVTDYIAAKKVGILRGAYCFAHPSTSTATDEANAFIDYVMSAGGFDSLPPALDLEVAEGKSPQELATFILQWESIVKQRTGKQMILYTYAGFVTEYLSSVSYQIDHIPLWLADYASTVPHLPGWTNWFMLQYSDTGHINGINGNVDLDALSGSISQPTGGINLTVGQIKQLQTNLKAVLKLPSTFAIDGQYGPATTAAVKSFQYQFKLTVDGIAGPQTIAALNKAVDALTPPAPKVTAPTPAPTTKAAPTLPPVSQATETPAIETVTADKKAQLTSIAQQLTDAIKAL